MNVLIVSQIVRYVQIQILKDVHYVIKVIIRVKLNVHHNVMMVIIQIHYYKHV